MPEILGTLKDLLAFGVSHVVSVMMLAVGLELTRAELRGKADRPLIKKALLIALLFEPLLALVVVKLFDFGPVGAATILLMSVSPGAPLLVRKAKKISGDLTETGAALVLYLTLAAIILLPAFLWAFNRFAGLELESDMAGLMGSLFMAIVVPLGLGLFIRSFSPSLAIPLAKWAWRFFNIMFPVAIIMVVALSFPILTQLPLRAWGAMLLLTLISTAVTYRATRSYIPEKRQLMAWAVIMGNPSIALFVAKTSFPELQLLPVMGAYILLRTFFLLPFTIIAGKVTGGSDREQLSPPTRLKKAG